MTMTTLIIHAIFMPTFASGGRSFLTHSIANLNFPLPDLNNLPIYT